MKRIIILLSAGLLASCTVAPASEQPTEAPSGKVVAKLRGNDIMKFCDEGRAVYTVQDDNSAAIAVVENAKECQQGSGR